MLPGFPLGERLRDPIAFGAAAAQTYDKPVADVDPSAKGLVVVSELGFGIFMPVMPQRAPANEHNGGQAANGGPKTPFPKNASRLASFAPDHNLAAHQSIVRNGKHSGYRI